MSSPEDKVSKRCQSRLRYSFERQRQLATSLECTRERVGSTAVGREQRGLCEQNANDGRKTVEKIWKSMKWAIRDGEVPVMRAVLCDGEPPHDDGKERCPSCKEDVMISLRKIMKHPMEKKRQKGRGVKKKPRDLGPLVLEKPAGDKKLMQEIKGDSKTVVDWVNGLAKLKTSESTIATAQNLLWKWWNRGVDLQRRVADWAVHIFREHNEEADVWSGKGAGGREEEWVNTADVVWFRSRRFVRIPGW